MYLKKLEIQGFKSFANKTVLDFERGVSVVVGPNGSGKSNVADSLRFVLGEQGMRNIRAKKSEDLIFSGSGSKSKMNIAEVALHFDNSDKVFPVDFTEVSISRKIFRDGENQYFVNGSQVRLKDLAEFIAKAKLGLKGYTIINQGMGDYVLNASPKERKEIIDEALGLREFQIKKNEAISKLNQTENNLEKTESLIRELTPHLRFLKRQVDKLEERDRLQKELLDLQRVFVEQKKEILKKDKDAYEKKKEELRSLLGELEEELKNTSLSLEDEEKKVSGFFGEIEDLEKKLFEIETKKSSLQRDLGKIEGAIDFRLKSRNETPKEMPISISYIKDKLNNIKKFLSDFSSLDDITKIKDKLKELSSLFEGLISDINLGKVPISENIKESEKQEEDQDLTKLKKERDNLVSLLNSVESDFLSVKEKIKALNLSHHKEKENIFNLRNKKDKLQGKIFQTKREIEEIEFKLKAVLNEFDVLKRFEENKDGEVALSDLFSGLFGELLDISRNIERIKIKLEDSELIDESILDEYKETKDRLEFLEKETKDLKDAISSLKVTIEKLNVEIEDKFKKSFNSINKNFNRYFNILFGGGSAKLQIINEKKDEDKDSDNDKKSVLGVDVSVSLPGKKVNSLSVLSGGERTLSSLALLFALVSTSPPPFLVLDEVDAPLDEANSNRFLRILDDLKGGTQFIIITHNRETMRQADILYGVTMQEDGVSQLLSLKFEEALKTID